jgi:hypothetical protein
MAFEGGEMSQYQGPLVLSVPFQRELVEIQFALPLNFTLSPADIEKQRAPAYR